MLAAGNLLKPSDGRPVTVPTQDMVLGSYYLTLKRTASRAKAKSSATSTRRLWHMMRISSACTRRSRSAAPWRSTARWFPPGGYHGGTHDL
ncbi:MAG: hypothetical protein ACLS8R_04175 [Anaeromassilibacillus sp.]